MINQLKRKRFLALILSIALICLMVNNTMLYVQAESDNMGEQPASPYKYLFDVFGSYGVKISFEYSFDEGENYKTLITSSEPKDGISDEIFGFWSDEFGTGFYYDFEPEVKDLENYTGKIKIKLTVINENAEDAPQKKIVSVMHGEKQLLDEEDVDVEVVDNVSTFAYSIDTKNPLSDGFVFDLAYENEGDPKAEDLIKSNIYAYGDLDQDGDIDAVDMEHGLRTELCCKYFWEEGGLLDGYFEINEPSDFNGRIQVTVDGTYSADKANGTQVELNKYIYKINLGVDHEGKPVKVTGNVYALRSNTDILVYDGTKFYIRDLSKDAVSFNGKSNDDKAICVLSNFNNLDDLKINGNGGGNHENINPENSNVFTVFLWNGDFVEKYNRYYSGNIKEYHKYIDACNKLRIMRPGDTYVAIQKVAGEGEQKRVHGINFDSADSVCETGTNKYTEVFVGDNILHINPIAAGTGLANTSISNISLSETSQTDGIKLTKISNEDYKIEFKSNYYDEATIEITYDNGQTRNLTIKRQALVISYEYLMDNGPGVSQYEFRHGGETSSTTVDYNYYEGQQVIIYATYYHPSNYETASGDNGAVLYVTDENGSVRIIEPLKYTAATNDTVATTDYLIGFVAAKEKNPDDTWGEPLDNISQPSINALVVNSGFDNSTTFSGTQIGNGQGVYWDGEIKWNY